MQAQPVGRLAALWRYPVSSTAGQTLQRCAVDASGLEGDRTHALVASADGETATPERKRRWHTAAFVQSRLAPDGTLDVATPGQPWSPAPSAGPALAAHFGFAVDALPYGAGARPRYRRGAVNVLTTASLRALQALLPDSVIAPGRFRPNVIIDTAPGLTGFIEQSWIGRDIVIGSVHLRVTKPCGRCSFTTLPQAGFDLDRGVLRALIQVQDRMFGVTCDVIQAGELTQDAPVSLFGPVV